MKNLLFLLGFTLLSSFVNAQSNDLIADFPFSGNANDVSGNGNHGTVHGATLTEDRFGNPNSAYDFNGTSGYIDFPASSSMGQIYTAEEFTISAWIKIRSWYNDWNVFSIIEQYNPNTDMGSLLLEANWATGGINFIAGYNAPFAGCNFTWNFNQWYNITMTYNKSLQEAKFYIDGSLIQTVAYNGSFSEDLINPYVIGRSLSGPDEYSNGVIDDMKIFKRALTSQEVGVLVSTGNLGAANITLSKNISIYPNPVSDFINIKSSEKIKSAEIFDMSGKTVAKFNNTQNLDVSTLEKGVYVIKISTEKGVNQQKFIKK
ncbi:MAG: T9SS type A sorting domain-containing protein [Bergeyella sp.]